jgi:glycerol-3-phosphate acyltransferase PlsX
VVVDAMGGDDAPAAVVAGAVAAWREHGVPVTLVGRAAEVRRELARHGAAGAVAVVHAEEVVPMAEPGAGAITGERRSSLVVGCEMVAGGTGAALVSAGSTGAVVACAIRALGLVEGVLRPALAVPLPSQSGGHSVLVDAGATSDPTPEMMAQFALFGVSYARIVLGVADPSVGLLSLGSEPGKGNRLARRTAELLPKLPLRLHGNVEGHDVLSGVVDVIVTDGFTGNVVLKNVEGTVRSVLAMVAAAGIAGPAELRAVARLYEPRTHGGAALLGLRGTVVVAHGSSGAGTIARACVLARDLAEADVVARVKDHLSRETAP